MLRHAMRVFLIALLAATAGYGQQANTPAAAAQGQVATRRERLLTAKLVAVPAMPNGLDRWLIEELRNWGKYKVTVDPEGVDLEIRSYDPEKEPQFRIRRGIPQPKREKHEPPPVLSVSVIDWVSNEALWQADLLNKKPKEGEDTPAGPQTQISARGLKPQQLAQELISRLRQYVSELERAATRKP
jgi:hypothetical protein